MTEYGGGRRFAAYTRNKDALLPIKCFPGEEVKARINHSMKLNYLNKNIRNNQ